MARALRIAFPGAFYHVTLRGNERKAVFKSKRVWNWLVFNKDKVLARDVKMHLCQRYTSKKLKEISLNFGFRESGVSQTCRRVAQKMEKDKKLKKRLIDWKSK